MKLSVTNFRKQYRRDFWGLNEFTLDVGPEILSLLGPDSERCLVMRKASRDDQEE